MCHGRYLSSETMESIVNNVSCISLLCLFSQSAKRCNYFLQSNSYSTSNSSLRHTSEHSDCMATGGYQLSGGGSVALSQIHSPNRRIVSCREMSLVWACSRLQLAGSCPRSLTSRDPSEPLGRALQSFVRNLSG